MSNWDRAVPNQKEETLWIIGIHRSPDDHDWRHPRLSIYFKSFPIQEVPLSRYWPFVGYANDFRHLITGISSPNWFPAVVIYILSQHWPILATRRPMPAQYLAIFGENEWQCTIESRVFIYLFNHFAHYFCLILLLYPLFYSMVHKHIRISLNIIYSIINSCQITYLHCWCFALLTGFERGPFILRRQHSTPRLQGTCACGILVSPRR